MADRPSGTVSFLFTDVVGSSPLWDAHPRAMAVALRAHDDVVRRAVEEHGGVVFSTAGDSFAAAFRTAGEAVGAAVALQQRLLEVPWPDPISIDVRVGVHTGEADERDGDYFGGTVNRAARVMAAAHGGQILVSQATADLVLDRLESGLGVVAVGEVALKGLERPERLFQVVARGLREEFPPVAGTAGPVVLPQPITALFGRVDEIEHLDRLLRDERLVTVVGFGGVGKTRVAIETAHRVADRFGRGVWFCDLAPVSAPEAVPIVLAQTIGAVEEPGRSLLESIVTRLRGSPALVLLDNCEHVLDAAATLVAGLVAACPEFRVLATSRQALGVAGEQVVPLGPLPSDSEDAAGVQLFVDRARHVRPGFELDDTNRADIVAVCRAVDGISLAIELAAARVRTLPPSDLAARLGDRFRLLRSRSGDVVARHRTLLSTVEWSHQLLSPEEQDLFDRLSVFAGRFDLAAAEAVGASGSLDRLDVDDVLDALVDKSLVIAEHEPTARFRLLDTLRHYGQQRLDQRGLLDVVHRAHAVHYGDVVEAIALAWATAEQPAANPRMDDAFANLREACAWATGTGEIDLGARIVLPIFVPVIYRLAHEVGDWAARLAATDAAAAHPLTPQLLGFAATIDWLRGNYERADAVSERALALEAALGLPPHWRSRYGAAALAYMRGDETGLAVYTPTVDTMLAGGPMDRVFHYNSSANMLTIYRHLGVECAAAADAGVAEAEPTGSPALLAIALSARAGQRIRQARPDAAGAWADARRAIVLARQADARYLYANATAYGLQAASLLERPEGLDDVLPDIDRWDDTGSVTQVWRFVASALPLLWRRGERVLCLRIRASMDANPWRRLGSVVERVVQEIDLAVPEDERLAVAAEATDPVDLLHAVVAALRTPPTGDLAP